MSSIQLNEPIVRAIVAQLGAPLNTAIDAINGETASTADGFLLEHPTEVLDYVPHISQIRAFPLVGIQDGPGNFEDDLGHSQILVADQQVWIFAQDQDPQALARKLRRYRRAVVRALFPPDRLWTSGPWSGPVFAQFRGYQPGQLLGELNDEEDAVTSWMNYERVTIRLRNDEPT